MPIQTATNPETGERLALIGGQWQPFTQSATNKEGAKAFLIGDKWVTGDEAPTQAAPPSEGIPSGRGDVPEWGRKNPTLYGIAGAAREVLGPIIEAGGALLGGAGGAVAGAPAGPVGAAAGGVAGAGGGYAAGKEITRLADIA